MFHGRLSLWAVPIEMDWPALFMSRLAVWYCPCIILMFRFDDFLWWFWSMKGQ
jgi:hypothetical protein